MALNPDRLVIKPSASLKRPILRQHLSNILNATRGFKKNVKVVDDVRDVKDACDKLKCHNQLIVDCEGVELGRTGKLTLVQVMAKDGDIYIFDVLVLGRSVFDYGLKSILESQSVLKIMFDCRMDADSIWHEYNVKITNVLDMQLLEYMVRPLAGTELRGPRLPKHFRKPCIRGLNNSVETYVRFRNIISNTGISEFKKVKEEGSALMNKERTVWRYRPIHEGLINYAALDVVMIDLLQDALTRFMQLQGVVLESLKIASERYTCVRRDFDLVDDAFMRHPVLISYIIPEIRGNSIVPFPYEDAKCTGCKRLLLRDFIVQSKCGDCREIERANRFR